MCYEHLREKYPETVSMEQLYRICHISKRKARWLLEQGIIPCRDSEKHTRRFQIRLENVIGFLERRDAGELEDMIPDGIFSSGDGTARALMIHDYEALCAFILSRWEEAPDMLTSNQAAELCGYGLTTMNQWLRKGILRGVNYRGANLISKESLAAQLASAAGQRIAARSERHRELLEAYRQEEQNSGMEWGSMSLS